MDSTEIIVITGPTATGKTSLALLLAEHIDAEIVSADSMLVYRHMDIGTAKPTLSQRQSVPHHMIDIVPPWEDYSAARYIEDARRCIDDIISRQKLPIIVGGTGLYIDSLISGRSFSSRADMELRSQLEKEYDEIGGESMLNGLGEFDPTRAQKLHPNDKKRIVRAYEAYLSSGKTISQHDRETSALPPLYNTKKYALTYSDRAVLYDRIDKRVDLMLEMGLISEVRKLIAMGIPRDCTAMQGIGYKELLPVILHEGDLHIAIDKIKMESRRYGKRQLTWLRRDESVIWLNRDDAAPYSDDDLESIAETIMNQSRV